MTEQLDRDFLIFRILGMSRWNEEALRKKSDKQLQSIYEQLLERESYK